MPLTTERLSRRQRGLCVECPADTGGLRARCPECKRKERERARARGERYQIKNRGRT